MRTWKKTGTEWVPCENLPLGDRGFRYGMSVFETIAVREGKPLILEEHLEPLIIQLGIMILVKDIMMIQLLYPINDMVQLLDQLNAHQD
jgi:hypothetical protein